MAVGVVRPHGDQCDPGAAGGQEVRIGIAAAVVGHLQHVGTQIGALGEQAGLRLGAEVPGEKDGHPVGRDPDDEGQIVGLGGRGRASRVGRQNFHGHAADGAPVPRNEDRAVPTAAPHLVLEPPDTVVGRGEGPRGDHPDLTAGERACQAADVVGVQMGDEDERQRADGEPVEAAVDGTDVRTGVHEHPRAGADGQHEGISLADVAADRDGPRWRPPPDRLPQRPAQDEETDQCSEGQRPEPPEPP
jgi:hypothetical protein